MAFEMNGEFVLPAPREVVWQALNDPAVLCRCIQGCQNMERVDENSFIADVKMKIGPVSAIFNGKVDLLDIDAPKSYRIHGQGNGGAAGFAKGGATVTLSESDGGTLLRYNVNAEIGGKLAQLGGRLINGVAKRQADQFFENFAAQFDTQAAVKGEVKPRGEAAAATAASPAADAAPGDRPFAWLLALAVAVVAGYILGRSEADTLWVVAMVVLALVSAAAGFHAGRR